MSGLKLETGVQLLARLGKNNCVEGCYPNLFGDGPKQCEIAEIFSDFNMNVLVNDLICEVIMPPSAGGANGGVLIFNTDGNFNIDCITNIIRSKILQLNFKIPITTTKVDEIIQNSLQNLFILNIYDATQFYTSIYNSENILTENRKISLLIFNTLTAFYWSEQGNKIKKMDSYIKELLRTIQSVTKEYRSTIIFTRPEYFNSSKNEFKVVESNLESIIQYVDYRIHILCNTDKDVYTVNIKSKIDTNSKTFKINNDLLEWHM